MTGPAAAPGRGRGRGRGRPRGRGLSRGQIADHNDPDPSRAVAGPSSSPATGPSSSSAAGPSSRPAAISVEEAEALLNENFEESDDDNDDFEELNEDLEELKDVDFEIDEDVANNNVHDDQVDVMEMYHQKTALFKVYDYTKIGTDTSGI